MTVFAHTAHKQVDSSGSLDSLLVGCTLGSEVSSIAVEDVDILLRNIHVVEEVACHKAVVAFRVVLRQTYIFVHIEGNDILEGNLTGFVQANQFLVCSDRGPSGRKTENERLVGNSSLGLDA